MEQLGIEPVLLLAQIVNFAIIIFVLRKLLYKPILDLLDRRKNVIAEGVALTEKMRTEEEKLATKRAKVLDTARSEAQAIIAEAKRKAKDEADTIMTSATTEASSIIERGKAEIATARKSMEKEMRSYAVSLAVSMAKRVLATSLDMKDREQILDKHIKELETVNPSA